MDGQQAIFRLNIQKVRKSLTKYQDMPKRSERDDEDYGEGDKGKDISRGAPKGRHLTRLEGATWTSC